MKFSSFLAGRMIETLGVDSDLFSNLSRYGVSLNESIIDLMRKIHAPQTPIKITIIT
jgi:hypothetical protein